MMGFDETDEATKALKRLRDRVGARGRAFQRALMGVDRRVGKSMLDEPVKDGNSPDVSRFEMFLSRPNQPYGADDLAAIDADADVVWKTDQWRPRLEPFIQMLGGSTSDAAGAFESLVAAGCQPDFLAENLYRSELLPGEPTEVGKARKLRAKLRTKLKAAANAAEMLQCFETRNFGESLPNEWISQLRAMIADHGIAPREERSADGARFAVVLPYAYLLLAADHVRDVTGTARLTDLLKIVDAIREKLGRPVLADNESLSKRLTRARSGARKARASLTAEIDRLGLNNPTAGEPDPMNPLGVKSESD